MELRQEAGEREAGLLEARERDRALEPAAARNESETQPLRTRLEQLANCDRQ